MKLGEFADAEGYLALADQAAAKLAVPHNRILVKELLGEAQLSANKPREAVATWMEATELCNQFACPDLAHPVLDRLIALYRKAGMESAVEAFQRQKTQLQEVP